MKKVVTFGELMIRLQPYHYERLIQAEQLQFTFGGAEANAAVFFALSGLDSLYVTKLPEHEVGQSAVCSLRKYGVNTSRILRGGERIGIYFNEKAVSQKPALCIYDRKHSAVSEADPSEYNWEEIFQDADWFHFTGITPAISPNAAEACLDACRTAKKKGIRISCDLNYREKLWTMEEARETLRELCQYVDLCICNETEAREVFDIIPEEGKEKYSCIAEQMAERYGFEYVGIDLRENVDSCDYLWSGMFYSKSLKQSFFSKKYPLHIVDRVGAGDSFGAGLVYGVLEEMTPEHTIEFAAALSALKHTVEGDYCLVAPEEAEALIRS